MKKRFIYLLIIATAFLLNLVWEYAHHVLYKHYKGGAITNILLLRVSINDALILLVIALAIRNIPVLEGQLWLLFITAFLIATAIEWHALTTGRWAYGENMPVIPMLKTGLTPTIQLSLTGTVAYLLTFV